MIEDVNPLSFAVVSRTTADSVQRACLKRVDSTVDVRTAYESTRKKRRMNLFALLKSRAITLLQTRCNALAWNPREAFNFTVANEDCNCYTYDMRKMKSALCVHKDHVSAV